MMDKLLNVGADWLETSRLPPVIAALMIMLFALRQIWRELK
jgi:hypothetical protein